MPKIPLEIRYERHIERLPDGGCWLWNGNRNQAGYGQLRVGRTGNGPVISVHRWAYEKWKGPIGKGLMVLHKCDNPRCSNPEHLYAGTGKQNAADAIARGRRAKRYKFGPRKSKLSDDDVRAIRASEEKTWQIAHRFNISETHAYQIKTRRRKAHVPDPAGPVQVDGMDF